MLHAMINISKSAGSLREAVMKLPRSWDSGVEPQNLEKVKVDQMWRKVKVTLRLERGKLRQSR